MIERSALVHALMHTPFVVNTGAGVAPVGGSRPMTGTEAHDVADLVLGAAPDREGSPFADDQVPDAEPRHEVECSACGATIRARMADAPDDQGDDDDAPGLRALAAQPRRYHPDDQVLDDDRELWVRVMFADTGQEVATTGLARLPWNAPGGVLGEVWVSSAQVRPLLASLPTPTDGQAGIDTCRHRQAPRVAPGYEISESGHVPED